MKTHKSIWGLNALFLAAGTALAGVSSLPLDLATGSYWRTAANSANESDGQYGSDGYVLFGINLPNGSYTATGYEIGATANNQYQLPGYISAVVPYSGSYSMWSGNGNFGQIEDPANGNALTPTPALLSATRPGTPCDLTLRRGTSQAFRLTIVIGISSDGGYANNGMTITVNAGGAGSAMGSTAAAPVGGTAGTPGMMYLTFDIGSGSDDILIRNSGSGANLAGLAFDPVPATAASITTQPVGATLLEGVAFQLSVVAAGSEPISYQWYKDEEIVPDATSAALSFPGVTSNDAGTYTVVVANDLGAVTSSPAIVVVESTLPEKILQYEAAVRDELFLFSSYPFDARNADDAIGLNNGTLVGNAQFGPGPAGGANQALLLNGAGHVTLGTVPDFTFPSGKGAIEAWVRADWTSSPGYNPTLFANREGGSTRYSIHMMAGKTQLAYWNGIVGSTIDIPPASNTWHLLAISFDTASWTLFWDGVAVMTAAEGFGTGVDLPTQIGSATSAATSEGWIGGFDEVSFFSDLLSLEQVQAHYNAFAVGDPPSMRTEPQGGLFFVGAPFTLSALATGPELVYQWYKHGTAITDATSTKLEFAALSSGDSGDYFVVVTNSAGAVTSVVAKVDVRVPDFARYQTVVKAEPSLISFYSFDDATANDGVSTFHGTLNGTTTFAPGLGGSSDQALIISGGGYVTLGTVADFAFETGVGTAEAWVRADWDAGMLADNPCIFANRADGENTQTRWSIHMMQNQTQIAFWNGANIWMAQIPPAGHDWHLLTSVFDQGNWRLYWDGQPILNVAAALGNNGGYPTQIGSATSSSIFEGWVGGINELAFYREALSDGQALNHYKAMVEPGLNYARDGNLLTISWNQALEGFTLESTSVLPAVTWEPVEGVVNNSVTVDTLSGGAKFYRLSR